VAKPRLLRYYYWLVTVTLLIVLTFYLRQVLVHRDLRRYQDPLSSANPKIAVHIVKNHGWLARPDGLAILPGTTAERVYEFNKDPAQEVLLTLSFSIPPGGDNKLLIQKGDAVHVVENVNLSGESLNITSKLPGYGPFYITVAARRPAAESPTPTVLVREFECTIFAPHSLHTSALVFFVVLASLLYGLILYILVPDLVHIDLAGWIKSGGFRPTTMLFIAAFCIFGALIWSRRQWYGEKKYDDIMAVSNASLLLDQGFDTEALYFRSRLRPAYIGFVQPLVTFFPNTLVTVTKSPADFQRRIWRIYDRDAGSYGKAIYPEVSAVSLLLPLLIILCLYRIFRLLEVEQTHACLATLLGMFFFSNALSIVLTQSFELFINLFAVYLALRAFHCSQKRFLLPAALAMSLAILTKTSAVTSAIPVALLQIVLIAKSGHALKMLARTALYWSCAALVPLIWFEGFLQGTMHEYATFFREVMDAQQLQQYPSISVAGALVDSFKVFSLFLPVAWVGMVLSLRRRAFASTQTLFFFFWAIGASSVFLLPYIFPRFLQFFIPSIAYFASIALLSAARYTYRATANASKQKTG
jgi:hypothetical protein